MDNGVISERLNQKFLAISIQIKPLTHLAITHNNSECVCENELVHL